MISSWSIYLKGLSQKHPFYSNSWAFWSSIIFGIALILSLTAELWISNRPLVLFYQGRYYFPAFVYYPNQVFDQRRIGEPKYRKLLLGVGDWALWPIVQWSPSERNTKVQYYPSPPTDENILGTDDRGRDVFARLIYGFRYSMFFALGSSLLSLFIGCFLGILTSFIGGWLDTFTMGLVELWESIPPILLIILYVSFNQPQLLSLIVFSSLWSWISLYYYLRSEVFHIKQQSYIKASQVMGSSQVKTLVNHVWPHVISPVSSLFPFLIMTQVMMLTKLDYLGFGLKPPTPNWGELLQQGQSHLIDAPWLFWGPFGFISVTFVLLNLMGEGLRDKLSYKTSLKDRKVYF